MLQENNIKLSIIIPVYNEESFLTKLFEQIENYFNHNQAKFEEISFLLETEKVNFTTFIRKLIQKHEQAIST